MVESQTSRSLKRFIRAVGGVGGLAFFLGGSAAFFLRYSSILFFRNRPAIDVVMEETRRFFGGG